MSGKVVAHVCDRHFIFSVLQDSHTRSISLEPPNPRGEENQPRDIGIAN